VQCIKAALSCGRYNPITGQVAMIASVDLSDHFRQQAWECRQLASMVRTDDNKAFWLRLAEDSERLAAMPFGAAPIPTSSSRFLGGGTWI
jgi:hypothetical protein